MLKSSAEFGERCLAGFKQSFPDLAVAEFNLGDPLNSQVLTLKSKGVSALFSAGLEGDLVNTLKVMKELRYRPVLGTFQSDVSSEVVRNFGADLEGVSCFGFRSVDPSLARKYLKLAPATSADSPLEAAALSYVHVRQMYAAVAACEKDDLACQIKKMAESKPDPAIGFRGFNARSAEYEIALKSWHSGRFEVK